MKRSAPPSSPCRSPLKTSHLYMFSEEDNTDGRAAFVLTLPPKDLSIVHEDVDKYTLHVANIAAGTVAYEKAHPWLSLYDAVSRLAWLRYSPSADPSSLNPGENWSLSCNDPADRRAIAIIRRAVKFRVKPCGTFVLSNRAAQGFLEIITDPSADARERLIPTGDHSDAPAHILVLEERAKTIKAAVGWNDLIAIGASEPDGKYDVLPRAFFPPDDQVFDDTEVVLETLSALCDECAGEDAWTEATIEGICGAGVTSFSHRACNDYRRMLLNSILFSNAMFGTGVQEAVLLHRAIGITLGADIARDLAAKLYVGLSLVVPNVSKEHLQLIRCLYGQAWFPSAFMNIAGLKPTTLNPSPHWALDTDTGGYEWCV